MKAVEVAKKLGVPNDRFNTFKVILTRMKYDEKILLEETHYIVSRGNVDYLDSAIPIIKARLKKTFKREKLDYSKRKEKS